MKVIGIAGLIGSGKDTVGDMLVNNHGFRRVSYASTLKDAVAVIFGWDREMLEGKTSSARAEREVKDEWWSRKLGMPITPRFVLQHIGTDVLRRHFHDDIWIASVERRISSSKDDVVITDCRFWNEMDSVISLGGSVHRIHRGPNPDWYDDAIRNNQNRELNITLPAHTSETSHAGYPRFFSVIDNNGSLDDLKRAVDRLVR